jgi:hypothetical protein
MSIPGGTGTRYVTDSSNPPVLVAPASLIGSELSYEPGSGPRFAPLLCLKDTAMDINNV